MHEKTHDMSASSGRSSGALAGFLVGAAVGAAVALLMAPGSGAETRSRLAGTARRWGSSIREGVDDARTHLSEAKDEARGRIEHIKADVRTAVDAGREAFVHERDKRREHPVETRS